MSATTPWLLRPNPSASPRVRLFCLGHAGAGASVFYPWARELPADVDVCAVQLPGRENRLGEPALTRMGPLVDGLARAISPLLGVPYALFGHSMGATVGFELARALRRKGAPGPVRLFAAGRRAPHLPTPPPLRHTLQGPAFIAELRHLGGTPAVVLADPDLLSLFAGILRADFAVLETHTFIDEPPLACPITVLHADDDREVRAEQSAAWAQHTAGGATVHLFRGGHFFVHQQRAAVLQRIVADLSDLSIGASFSAARGDTDRLKRP